MFHGCQSVWEAIVDDLPGHATRDDPRLRTAVWFGCTSYLIVTLFPCMSCSLDREGRLVLLCPIWQALVRRCGLVSATQRRRRRR